MGGFKRPLSIGRRVLTFEGAWGGVSCGEEVMMMWIGCLLSRSLRVGGGADFNRGLKTVMEEVRYRRVMVMYWLRRCGCGVGQ